MFLTAWIEKLARDRWLTTGEYARLLRDRTPESAALLRRLADRERRKHYGTRVYLRGIVDVSSICPNGCVLCSQRIDAECLRYRMRPREILDCCEEAQGLELSNLVLRCGPDRFYSEKMLSVLVERLHRSFPDCSVTLAMGERSREGLEMLYNAGADRYLLLQETAEKNRFRQLHPPPMCWERRLHGLNELMDIGFQTGCGFLVGWPGQTVEDLSMELKFLEEFQPHSVELVSLDADGELLSFLISLVRLILPNALLTAPGDPAEGVLAGANVISVGVTPRRDSFPLCGGGRVEGPATIDSLAALRRELADVGFEVDMGRDDWNG